ncbi:MAG: ABC transporter permease, partial [Planctomycetota bacterium]
RVLDHPRLKYGGGDLKDVSERGGDITGRIILGLLLGVGVGAALGFASFWLLLWRNRGRRRRSAVARQALKIGAFLTACTVVAAILAELAAGYHVLGTDKVGKDVLFSALKGCRVGIIVGTLTTLIATPLAILLGIMAGYFGGRIDDVVQYVYTTLNSIPSILRIAAVMLIVTALLEGAQSRVASDMRLLWLCVVLGIGSWTGLCRLLRGETLKLRENEYVQAAEAFGVGALKIMFRHILPNVMHIVLISVILRFSGLVMAEAVLAYVGIGVDPSMESWGNMINAARLEISRDPMVWWNLLAAFIFMFGLVLPANIFGDAVRDALDPRLKTE